MKGKYALLFSLIQRKDVIRKMFNRYYKNILQQILRQPHIQKKFWWRGGTCHPSPLLATALNNYIFMYVMLNNCLCDERVIRMANDCGIV